MARPRSSLQFRRWSGLAALACFATTSFLLLLPRGVAAANFTSPWVEKLLGFFQPEEERAAHRNLCFEKLKEQYVQVIQSVVPEGKDVVLLGVSRNMSPAQALSLYGEIAGLLAAGANLRAVCFTFDDACALSAVRLLRPEGAVFVHGGEDLAGTTGALLHGQWVKIIQACQDRRLVILPQAHWFREVDQTSAEKFREWPHPDAHLLVTSQKTLQYSTDKFGNFFASIQLIPQPAINYGHIQLPRWVHKALQVMFVGAQTAPPESEDSAVSSFTQSLKGKYSFEAFNWTAVREAHKLRGKKQHLARSFLLEHAFDLSTAVAKALRRGRVIVAADLPVMLLSILADIHVVALNAPDAEEEIRTLYGWSGHCYAGFRFFTAKDIEETRKVADWLYDKNLVPL